MTALLRKSIVVGLLAYLLICAAYFFGQDSFIFVGRAAAPSPAEINTQMVAADLGDAVVRGLLVNPDRTAPTVFYFGGNAESATAYAARFAALPARTYLIDYRGYGDSDGEPSQSNLVSDATRLVTRFTDDAQDVYLVGRSLGAGVAALAAANLGARVSGMVLVSPYCSFENVAALHAPAFLPTRALLAHPFDVQAIAPRLPRRMTLVVGLADRVIPPAESQCLARSLHPDTELIEISGAGHNAVLNQSIVWQAIKTMVTPSAAGAPPHHVLL